jgi:threonine aldolase
MAEKLIDLRSDTVTRPTLAMRQAMFDAEVGDDVIGDDPTVHRLEMRAAELLGKQAALFVPSGTFGNQVALMTHCRRGNEVILSESCHIVQHEVGGAAALAGVQLRTIAPHERALTWSEIEPRIRRGDDIHFPETALIALENALSDGSVQQLDAAAIFNAATTLGVPASEIAANADSVMFCLSKGLGAPVGSMLVGETGFIARARKNRKLLGGGMRQVGILAAAGLVALRDGIGRLADDHRHARELAAAFSTRPELEVATDRVDINMVFLRFRPGHGADPEERFVAALRRHGVVTYPPEGGWLRFVTHLDVSPTDLGHTVAAIAPALAEM